jgi:transmembrane sensor
MSHQANLSRAEAEASAWFTKLKRPAITRDALFDFRDWKQNAENAAAFARVEKSWKAANGLRNDPDIKALTAEALKRHSPRPTPVQWRVALPAALAVAVLVSLGGLWSIGALEPAYATRVGEQRLVPLGDGSDVRLNTDSKIRVRYRAGERRVILERGEAFFDVAHDPSRPFVVAADGAHVRALGTKFDVRRGSSGVGVTLVEGSVLVRQDGRPGETHLSPNQQLTVTAHGISAPRPTDAIEAASWTTGRLRFRNMALSDAVAEVNRYSNRKLVLDAPATLAAEPVTGEFDVGDTEAFVTALSVSFDLQASNPSGRTIRLTPRQGAPSS